MLKQIRAATVALEEICFSLEQKEIGNKHQSLASHDFLSFNFSRDEFPQSHIQNFTSKIFEFEKYVIVLLCSSVQR